MRNKHRWEPVPNRAVAASHGPIEETFVIRNPVALLFLALAMLLAPQAVCISRGHVQVVAVGTTSHHSAAMHAPPQGHDHFEHEGTGKDHFCADCQPPEFVGAAKSNGDAGSLLAWAPAIMPAVVRIPPALYDVSSHRWLGRAPPIPPPLPITTRVRLRI